MNRVAGYDSEIPCIDKLCSDQKAISEAEKKILMIADKTKALVKKCKNAKQRKLR